MKDPIDAKFRIADRTPRAPGDGPRQSSEVRESVSSPRWFQRWWLWAALALAQSLIAVAAVGGPLSPWRVVSRNTPPTAPTRSLQVSTQTNQPTEITTKTAVDRATVATTALVPTSPAGAVLSTAAPTSPTNAASNTAATTTWVSATEQVFGYSFSVPSNWAIQDAPEGKPGTLPGELTITGKAHGNSIWIKLSPGVGLATLDDVSKRRRVRPCQPGIGHYDAVCPDNQGLTFEDGNHTSGDNFFLAYYAARGKVWQLSIQTSLPFNMSSPEYPVIKQVLASIDHG